MVLPFVGGHFEHLSDGDIDELDVTVTVGMVGACPVFLHASYRRLCWPHTIKSGMCVLSEVPVIPSAVNSQQRRHACLRVGLLYP